MISAIKVEVLKLDSEFRSYMFRETRDMPKPTVTQFWGEGGQRL